MTLLQKRKYLNMRLLEGIDCNVKNINFKSFYCKKRGENLNNKHFRSSFDHFLNGKEL